MPFCRILKGIIYPTLLFTTAPVYSATHDDVQRLNMSLRPGDVIQCKTLWKPESHRGQLVIERTMRFQLVSSAGNTRIFDTEEALSKAGDKTPNVIIRYRMSATTDSTGETHQVDASTVSVSAVSSPADAELIAGQIKQNLTSYQSDSMISFTGFPDYTLQFAPDLPVTSCRVKP